MPVSEGVGQRIHTIYIQFMFGLIISGFGRWTSN